MNFFFFGCIIPGQIVLPPFPRLILFSLKIFFEGFHMVWFVSSLTNVIKVSVPVLMGVQFLGSNPRRVNWPLWEPTSQGTRVTSLRNPTTGGYRLIFTVPFSYSFFIIYLSRYVLPVFTSVSSLASLLFLSCFHHNKKWVLYVQQDKRFSSAVKIFCRKIFYIYLYKYSYNFIMMNFGVDNWVFESKLHVVDNLS